MAEASWFLIWRRAQQWTICRGTESGFEFHDLEVGEDQAWTAAAATIAAQLREFGYAGQPIVLGLPSDRCLAAGIPLDKKQRDYQALLFALEEKLPVAAEDLVADFVFSKESKGMLGVAVELKEMRPLLDELEKQEVFISVVCPTSLLALQNVLEELASSGRTICLWQQDDQVDCFLIDGRKPSQWSVLAANKDMLKRQLLLVARAWHDRYLCVGPATLA